MQASSRGFYDGRGQQSYPSSSGRYQPYDPAGYRSYDDQRDYRAFEEEEGPSPYSGYEQGYDGRNGQESASQDYYQEDNQRWEDPRGYGRTAQQEDFRNDPGGEAYPQDQQIFDVYSQQENDFLPPDGEAVVEDEQATKNSRVMDEVQSFYNRPESVVEDVQKFYDERGQRIEGPPEVNFTSSKSLKFARMQNEGYLL